MNSELLTTQEAADFIGVKVSTIRQWRAAGKLRPVWLADRPRYRREDLLAIRRPRVGNPDWIRAGEQQHRNALTALRRLRREISRDAQDRLLSPREVAELLNVSVEAVRRWRQVGILKPTWHGNRPRFRREDLFALERYLDVPRQPRRTPPPVLTASETQDEGLLTAQEVADLLGVKPNTVRLWHRRGLLPAVLVADRLRFRRDDVLAFEKPRPGNPTWKQRDAREAEVRCD